MLQPSAGHALVEFMPGRVVQMPESALKAPPTVVLCRLARQPNGLYAPVPIEWGPQVRMTRSLHEQLGLPCSFMTLRKLILSEMVTGRIIAPGTLSVDLGSLIDHFEATRVSWDKPRFWTAERIARFRQAEGAAKDVGE